MMSSLLFPLALAVATAVALAGTALYLHYRLVRITEVLARTASQVDTFAEASVAMGLAVERWLSATPNEAADVPALPVASALPGSSRRLLLQQAQQQLADGVPVQEVADYCGLSEDEVRLLSALHSQRYAVSA